MTNVPSLPGSSDSPGSSFSKAVCWLIILGSVGAIMIAPYLMRDRYREVFVAQSMKQADVQLLIASRYVVGVERAMPLKVMGAREVRPQLMGTLEDAARAPMDQFRATIVRGELDGKVAALRRLETLERAHPELHEDAGILRRVYAGVGPATQSAEAAGFHERHGWFADLAESNGKPDSDPERARVLSGSLRTMLVMAFMGVASVGAALIGAVILIIWIVFVAQGKWRFRFGSARPLPAGRVAYLEAFAVYLGGMVGLALVIRFVLHWSGMWGTLALPLPFLAALFWPRLRGQSWAAWRATVGLHRGGGVFKELACGALGYLTGLPVFAAGILVTLLLTKLSGVNASHPIVQEISADPWTVISLLLLASVWAPISEELMFRGTLFGHLRERLGWWSSGLTVSLIFAAIHPQGWAAIPALGSLAMVLAGIREWRGSILGCMMAHAINNTVLIVAVVLMLA